MLSKADLAPAFLGVFYQTDRQIERRLITVFRSFDHWCFQDWCSLALVPPQQLKLWLSAASATWRALQVYNKLSAHCGRARGTQSVGNDWGHELGHGWCRRYVVRTSWSNWAAYNARHTNGTYKSLEMTNFICWSCARKLNSLTRCQLSPPSPCKMLQTESWTSCHASGSIAYL